MTAAIFGATLYELAPLSQRYDAVDRVGLLGPLLAEPKTLATLAFSADDDELGNGPLRVLLRSGVKVEIEEAGSVVLRVSGVDNDVERTALCRAMLERGRWLGQKCLQARRSVAGNDVLLFPRCSGVRWLAYQSAAQPPARPAPAVRFAFLLSTVSMMQGDLLAQFLLRALRRLFRSVHLLVWFGVSGQSRFQLTETSKSGRVTRRFMPPVDTRYRALFKETLSGHFT